MPFRINHYPTRTRPDPVRTIYEHLTYYPPKKYMSPSRYSKTLCIRTAHSVHPNKFQPQAFEQSRAKECHETIYRDTYIPKSDDYFHEVNSVTENRLDLISYKFYNTPIYWWAIAQANSDIMFDPMNIPRGTILRIPPITDLYAGGVI